MAKTTKAVKPLTTAERIAAFGMNAKQFDSAVASIKKRGVTLQTDIHRALMAAMVMSMPDKGKAGGVDGGAMNAAPMAQIIGALPEAIRVSDVKAWIERHTNVVVKTVKVDGKTAHACKMVPHTDDAYKAKVDLIKADADPFWKRVKASDDAKLIGDTEFDKRLAMFDKWLADAEKEGKLQLSPAKLAKAKAIRELVKPPVAKNTAGMAVTPESTPELESEDAE